MKEEGLQIQIHIMYFAKKEPSKRADYIIAFLGSKELLGLLNGNADVVAIFQLVKKT